MECSAPPTITTEEENSHSEGIPSKAGKVFRHIPAAGAVVVALSLARAFLPSFLPSLGVDGWVLGWVVAGKKCRGGFLLLLAKLGTREPIRGLLPGPVCLVGSLS